MASVDSTRSLPNPRLLCQYELVVEARTGQEEVEAEAGRSEARVVVKLQDQNDHGPVFPRALHETQITEEDDRHLPKSILQVTHVAAVYQTFSS